MSCQRNQHQQQHEKHQLFDLNKEVSHLHVKILTSTWCCIYVPAAPILSAKSYNKLKFSPFFIPRPPLMTRLAVPRSGRSLFWISSLTHWVKAGLSAEGAASSEAASPEAAAASNAVPRTVTTLILSLDLTVAMALPMKQVNNLIHLHGEKATYRHK